MHQVPSKTMVYSLVKGLSGCLYFTLCPSTIQPFLLFKIQYNLFLLVIVQSVKKIRDCMFKYIRHFEGTWNNMVFTKLQAFSINLWIISCPESIFKGKIAKSLRRTWYGECEVGRYTAPLNRMDVTCSWCAVMRNRTQTSFSLRNARHWKILGPS